MNIIEVLLKEQNLEEWQKRKLSTQYEWRNNLLYYTGESFAEYLVYDNTKDYIFCVGEKISTKEINNFNDFYRHCMAIKELHQNKKYFGKVIKVINNSLILILLENNEKIATFCSNLNYDRGARGYYGRGPKISAVPEIGDTVWVKNIYPTKKGLNAYNWNYTDIDERVAKKISSRDF